MLPQKTTEVKRHTKELLIKNFKSLNPNKSPDDKIMKISFDIPEYKKLISGKNIKTAYNAPSVVTPEIFISFISRFKKYAARE